MGKSLFPETAVCLATVPLAAFEALLWTSTPHFFEKSNQFPNKGFHQSLRLSELNLFMLANAAILSFHSQKLMLMSILNLIYTLDLTYTLNLTHTLNQKYQSKMAPYIESHYRFYSRLDLAFQIKLR